MCPSNKALPFCSLYWGFWLLEAPIRTSPGHRIEPSWQVVQQLVKNAWGAFAPAFFGTVAGLNKYQSYGPTFLIQPQYPVPQCRHKNDIWHYSSAGFVEIRTPWLEYGSLSIAARSSCQFIV